MQLAQPFSQFFTHFGIQGTKRFIQKQDPRFNCEGAGERDTLTLSARKLRWKTIFEKTQLHHVEQRMDFVADELFAGTLVSWFDAQAKGHVFKHTHMTKQRIVLKHKTNLTLACPGQGRVIILEINAAIVRGLKPCDDP